MSFKRAAYTLIVFSNLLGKHVSYASSKQRPFGVTRGRKSNSNNLPRKKTRAQQNGGGVFVSNKYDEDINPNRTQEKASISSQSISSKGNAPLEPEPRKSRLLQIPMSVTLQKQGHSGAEHAVPISTFLDTGAQVTIMTLSAAKRAGIAHLIDTRYAGQATGVAGVSCRVLGRVPANTVSFTLGYDNDVVDKSPAITVLEGGIMGGDTIDMLLGLDVLEDWQAMVCLRDRTLTVRSGCRRSHNKRYVIPFVPNETESLKDNHRKSERHVSSLRSQTTSTNSRRSDISTASASATMKSTNPFARNASELESELDALDERSGRKFGDSSYRNDDSADIYDDYFTDDEEDASFYYSESDVDEYGEGNLSLGCDLSGI